MQYKFSDIVDIPTIQQLMESLWKASGIPVGIIDTEGTVLVATGWQEICTRFHRRTPETELLCKESDACLQEHLAASCELPASGHIEYQCKNGMIDIAVPIMIEGRHLASLFLGQFFYQSPDENFFRRQAERYGFDAENYLKALKKVPIFSRQKVEDILNYHTRFINLVTQRGVQTLNRIKDQEALRESEKNLRQLHENVQIGIVSHAADTRILTCNNKASELLGLSEDQMRGKDAIDPAWCFLRENGTDMPLEEYPVNRVVASEKKLENIIIGINRADKKDLVWVLCGAYPLFDEDNRLQRIVTHFTDISDRKQKEQDLQYREAFEAFIAGISTRFVELPPAEAGRGIDQALMELGEFVDADRSYVFLFSSDCEQIDNSHEWCSAQVVPQKDRLQGIAVNELPWAMEKILNRQILYVPSTADLPPDAKAEKAHWETQHIRSLIVVPIHAAGEVMGFLGLDSVRAEKIWAENDQILLKTIGEILANAINNMRAEEELKEREATLNSILAAAPVGIGLTQNRILRWGGETLLKMLGYSAEELIGKSARMLYESEEEFERVGQIKYKAIAERGTGDVETRWKCKNGKVIDVLLSSSPIDVSDLSSGVTFTALDISERKRAKSALRQALADAEAARDKIETILKSVADGLIFTDMDDRIVMMSVSAEALLGQTLSDLFLQPLGATIKDRHLNDHLSEIYAGGPNEALMNIELPSDGDGMPRNIQVKSSLVRDSEDHKTGVITLLRDVSRERELDRMKSEFISTAAHELKTPLTSVRGYSQLLISGTDIDIEQQTEFLSIINDKTEVLEKIIDDLLNISRVESGLVIHVERHRYDLGFILDGLVNQYQKECKNHLFALDRPEGPLEVMLDRGKIVQVMENLFTNAIKFSREESQIQVICNMSPKEVQVSVVDQGCGMTAEQIDRVFDKFYRVDSSNTAKAGLGLGMSIAKNIIESHGGKIWAESELGQGTTVSFTLPLEQ